MYEMIWCTNAQSLVAQKDEIRYQVVDRKKSEIIALPETRVTAEIGGNEVCMQ